MVVAANDLVQARVKLCITPGSVQARESNAIVRKWEGHCSFYLHCGLC